MKRPVKEERQLYTSPTQGWDKVGERLGQGLDKKQGLGKVWAGKVCPELAQVCLRPLSLIVIYPFIASTSISVSTVLYPHINPYL